MTTGYFDTSQSVYYNTPIPTSIAMVTSGNDIRRFEDQNVMTAVQRPRTKRMTVVAIISMIFNLLMASAITWSVSSYLNNKTRILVTDDKSSGAVSLLTSRQCDVPLSSALCTACVEEDSELLWSGKAVKVRTGNKEMCCRKVDQSLIALSKEVGWVWTSFIVLWYNYNCLVHAINIYNRLCIDVKIASSLIVSSSPLYASASIFI